MYNSYMPYNYSPEMMAQMQQYQQRINNIQAQNPQLSQQMYPQMNYNQNSQPVQNQSSQPNTAPTAIQPTPIQTVYLRCMSCGSKEEGLASIADPMGTPTYFVNNGTKEIYCKYIQMDGTSKFDVYKLFDDSVKPIVQEQSQAQSIAQTNAPVQKEIEYVEMEKFYELHSSLQFVQKELSDIKQKYEEVTSKQFAEKERIESEQKLPETKKPSSSSKK